MKLYVLLVLVITSVSCSSAQESWKASQLVEPSNLAAQIQAKQNPIIISVGPTAIIPGSYAVGMTGKSENIDKFKKYLAGISKDKEIIIYCGCCPFEHCPNVRPAFSLLNSLGYTNHKLLNLSNNIRTDWINKGYPVIQL